MGIERDMFNPLNDKPFLFDEELVDLGIVEPSEFYLQGIRPRVKKTV